MIIHTIGHNKKRAEEFFSIMSHYKIKRIIDVRLKNAGSMVGFTKKGDLKYFLTLHGIEYTHFIEGAPDDQLFNAYKKKAISWQEYKARYTTLMGVRDTIRTITGILQPGDCLLCSEPTPNRCHRGYWPTCYRQKPVYP